MTAHVSSFPAKRPRPTVLDGRFAILRPLVPAADANDLWEQLRHRESDVLWEYMKDGPFRSKPALEHYLLRHALSDDPFFFAIAGHESAKTVGFAAYLRIEQNHRTIEVGYVFFTPAMQRTPVATEAMYLMARHAFEDLGYRRYEWKCDARNAASRAAALRFGFTYEGTFRQHMISKDQNRDTEWYSMLDSEWPSRKAAFEQWLSPGNFDERGMQKRRLAELRA